jgi:uncharacterized membrane protein
VPEPQDDEEGPRSDAYGVGRLLAFSDGVFAIAMTLLIFNLPIPRAAPDRLVGALAGEQASFLGFVLSFVVVAAQWLNHHRLLRPLTATDRGLLLFNLGLLFFVCLLPFSTGLFARYSDRAPVAVAIYAGNLGLVGLATCVLRLYVSARPIIRSVDGHVPLRRQLMAWFWPTIFAASVPIAFWRPEVAELTWLLALPAGLVSRRW